MTAKLLTEPHLRFLSLRVGCPGSSESTVVKIPHCWKSRVKAHLKVIMLIPDSRLAPVLKTSFHQCVISYTCSQSNSDGSVLKQSRQSQTGYKYMI